MDVQELVDSGLIAAETSSAAATGVGVVGYLGNWTGNKFEAMGSLMKKYPKTTTVAVLGGIALATYLFNKNEKELEKGRELEYTLKGVSLTLKSLQPKETEDDRTDHQETDEGPVGDSSQGNGGVNEAVGG